MCATCFGLYLGHPQACQYKNLTTEGTVRSESRFGSDVRARLYRPEPV
jgi:hypothetical protein